MWYVGVYGCVLHVLCIVWRVHSVCMSHVDQMYKKSVFGAHLQYKSRVDQEVITVFLFIFCAISHMFHHLRHDMRNFLRFCQSAPQRKCEDLFEQKKSAP